MKATGLRSSGGIHSCIGASLLHSSSHNPYPQTSPPTLPPAHLTQTPTHLHLQTSPDSRELVQKIGEQMTRHGHHLANLGCTHGLHRARHPSATGRAPTGSLARRILSQSPLAGPSRQIPVDRTRSTTQKSRPLREDCGHCSGGITGGSYRRRDGINTCSLADTAPSPSNCRRLSHPMKSSRSMGKMNPKEP